MLTHIDETGMPGMVDVSDKTTTNRLATAQSIVVLPPELSRMIDGDEIQSPKGPVFQTAVIAGTMAAKRTWDLIPFCHPLPIDSVKISIKMERDRRVAIMCTVKTRHVTGVEMEALTGASVAALTIYDMCKAVSRDIVITETRLVEKRGGKSDVGPS